MLLPRALRSRAATVLLPWTLACASSTAVAQVADALFPHIVQKEGRSALFVDGAPYLILGAQVNNSSAWPAFLPKVWPAMEALHVNTVEFPVYWEQVEPVEGKFDFSIVDTLLTQARERQLHLILLWFGTWKNGSAHYMPEWMKSLPQRYPNIVGKDGKAVDSPSPFCADALAADKRAFTSVMTHLKEADPQHTVIMVQVENEPGTWGSVRDYSPTAQAAFENSVPPELLAALHRSTPGPKTDWQSVFGEDAEEFFHAWFVAHYIEQVAAAGKAAYPLPLYTNAALRDPLDPGRPPKYESGGPTDNVLPIWKAAAPSLDLLAPDIYLGESPRYFRVLELYHRPDNPLFVPETGSGPNYARYFFAALGHGTLGFSPFGLDFTREAIPTATSERETRLAPFALNYELAGPLARLIAKLNFEGKLQATCEADDKAPQTLNFEQWQASIAYGQSHFGPTRAAATTGAPAGRVLVAQLSDNQFLVAGLYCRVAFKPSGPAAGKPWQFIRVEEGNYINGLFHGTRRWNGDQTDWGLNFGASPEVLQVTLSTR